MMSILNLTLQSGSLARVPMDFGSERLMKKLAGLAEIRAAAESSPDFKLQLIKSINAVIDPFSDRFAVELKTFGQKILEIVPTIDIEKLTKLGLKDKGALHSFIDAHCYLSMYCFTFTKCTDDDSHCGPRLPLPVLSITRRTLPDISESLREKTDPSHQPSLNMMKKFF